MTNVTVITNADYRKRIERETDGFHRFTERRVKVGEKRVLIYPDFGPGPSIGKSCGYEAHRFHVVTVVCEADDYDYQGERMFTVKAADGWTGSAWASELFPLPKGRLS